MAIITPSMEAIAYVLKRRAELGFFDGQHDDTPCFASARRWHDESRTWLIYTRDIGYHSSGWFKNPDYERCYHLSLSFWEAPGVPRPFEFLLAQAWVKLFFGKWARFIWEESGSLPRRFDTPEIRHYRVFCDPSWQAFLPRGEVYTRDFIESGWKSWSDQQYDKQREKTHDGA